MQLLFFLKTWKTGKIQIFKTFKDTVDDLLFSALQLDQEVSLGDERYIVPVHQPNRPYRLGLTLIFVRAQKYSVVLVTNACMYN